MLRHLLQLQFPQLLVQGLPLAPMFLPEGTDQDHRLIVELKELKTLLRIITPLIVIGEQKEFITLLRVIGELMVCRTLL